MWSCLQLLLSPSLKMLRELLLGCDSDLQGFYPVSAQNQGDACNHCPDSPVHSPSHVPTASHIKELYVNKEAFWTSNFYAHDQSLTLGDWHHLINRHCIKNVSLLLRHLRKLQNFLQERIN